MTAAKPRTIGESVIYGLVAHYADHQALDEGLFRRYSLAEKCEIYRERNYGEVCFGIHGQSIVVSQVYWEWKCDNLAASDLESVEAADNWMRRNRGQLGKNIRERFEAANPDAKELSDIELVSLLRFLNSELDLATAKALARRIRPDRIIVSTPSGKQRATEIVQEALA